MRNCLIILLLFHNVFLYGMAPKLNVNQAIDRMIKRYGMQEESNLKSYFSKAGIQYPPKEIGLLAFKKERLIELWAKDNKKSWRFIHTYPLTAFSGRLGPKLKEHDLQIPEGIYRITSLNPFSAHHLSMMINYPNNFDRLQANIDGRKKLGGNIFLHGKASSVGCLAVGNKAIDQLFLLSHAIGLSAIKLIIAPNDLRLAKAATSNFAQPRWLPELYQNIAKELRQFPTRKTG